MNSAELALLRDQVARARIAHREAQPVIRARLSRDELILRSVVVDEIKARTVEDPPLEPIPARIAGGIRYATREEAAEARRRSHRDKQRRKNRERGTRYGARPCELCGTEFVPNKHAVATARYCGVPCRNRAYLLRRAA